MFEATITYLRIATVTDLRMVTPRGTVNVQR
jgi:hypothetical protein